MIPFLTEILELAVVAIVLVSSALHFKKNLNQELYARKVNSVREGLEA